ncbi:MAG: KEOPS complex subunit Pcc1 [Candidatus Thermoplasmatota archaeon]|jgi:tRNA threonylcarbamoyladenosine modification (KEOPS) complex  Pcc1 subunit|nr:KEOPS complex subunit Pcc1 [Candidatus Thermoplasmatota archaeon]
MKINCEIVIDFDEPKEVETVLNSIKIDDLGFIKSKADGKKLKAKIQTSSISSLIHTIDDYLSCVSVAMKVLDKD